MPEESPKAEAPVVIKKYANRRLYNTQTSSYVTLDHLASMVKEGTEFEVRDARTGEDITRSVLTQIIFEEEAKGQSLLPMLNLRLAAPSLLVDLGALAEGIGEDVGRDQAGADAIDADVLRPQRRGTGVGHVDNRCFGR